MLLGEGQADPAVAGADDVGFLQRNGQGVAHRLDHRIPESVAALFEGTQELALDVAGRGMAFHLQNRLVVDVEQQLEGQIALPAHRLARLHEAGAGEIAEEVGLAPGSGFEQRRRRSSQPAEDFRQGRPHHGFTSGEAGALDHLEAGVFEIAELFQELNAAEIALQVGQDAVDLAGKGGQTAELAAEQSQARVHQGLLFGDRGGGVGVGAGIGDASPENLTALIHHHRLGGGRPQVDADKATHVLISPQAALATPRRFCSIIWK